MLKRAASSNKSYSKNTNIMAQVRCLSSNYKGFKQSYALNKPMGTVDNFANGTSAVYVDQLYEDWKVDPNSVNTSWRAYFKNVEDGSETPYEAPPSLGQGSADVSIEAIVAALKARGITPGSSSSSTASTT
jgi:hypothetical protein